MFGLRDKILKTSKAAQYAEMNRIGLEFTELARAGEGERAVRKFMQLVACQPTWTQFHFAAMEFAAKKELLGPTIGNSLQDAIHDEPANGELRFIFGLFCQSIGMLDLAVVNYLEAIQLGKNDAVSYHNLGSAYYVQKKKDQAMEAWETSVKLDPPLAEPHFALGIMLGNLGKKKEAISHLEQFLKLAYPGLEGYVRDAKMQLQSIKSGK